jgi:hypothetical protein
MLFFLLLRRLNRTMKFRYMFTTIRNRVPGCFRNDRWFSCVAACVILVIGVGCESMATSKTESSESRVIREERGVEPADSKVSPTEGEARPAPPMEAFTDIHGKEGALKVLFLGDGRGDLPGVRREFQAVLETLSPLARQGYLHANFLLGPNLTKHKLESRVLKTQYSIVYYAGHTRESGRVLPFADSNLDTLEFLRIINQNPPGLLIMNACTSLGNPEKLDLMTPLLIESGVVFAIGTSSVVRDDMPVKSFPQLFESLIRGRTFGEALSDAIRKDPHGLEQYFLLGDPSMRLR